MVLLFRDQIHIGRHNLTLNMTTKIRSIYCFGLGHLRHRIIVIVMIRSITNMTIIFSFRSSRLDKTTIRRRTIDIFTRQIPTPHFHGIRLTSFVVPGQVAFFVEAFVAAGAGVADDTDLVVFSD